MGEADEPQFFFAQQLREDHMASLEIKPDSELKKQL
jgi:hypothetical protein